ncbi:MAG: VOC family protein [Acidimicrobiales bacterium]|nr:VOC family protein [Acidimicrobiales bacterium]
MHPLLCSALERVGLAQPTPSIVTKIIFPTVDMAASIGFYERLGFGVESYDEGYAWVKHDGRELFHLAHVADLDVDANRAAGYFHVRDVDEVNTRWSRETEAVSALADQPWGMREFAIKDPSNNLLRVGQNL